MNLFFKRKGHDNKQGSFIEQLHIERDNWSQVFAACLGKVMAIQTTCSEHVVKGQDWHIDFSEGVIRFGSQTYPIQFIGSESSSSNTWLWGWENINGFSEKILQLAQQTKGWGEQWNLEPLIAAELPLDDAVNGHSLAIVACGLAEKYCYYRGPHAGGAIFVAFSDVPDSVFAPVDVHKFLLITTRCIQQFPIDHKIFVEGFLTWNHTAYDWQGQTLIAHFQQDLKIEFEQTPTYLRIGTMTTA